MGVLSVGVISGLHPSRLLVRLLVGIREAWVEALLNAPHLAHMQGPGRGQLAPPARWRMGGRQWRAPRSGAGQPGSCRPTESSFACFTPDSGTRTSVRPWHERALSCSPPMFAGTAPLRELNNNNNTRRWQHNQTYVSTFQVCAW